MTGKGKYNAWISRKWTRFGLRLLNAIGGEELFLKGDVALEAYERSNNPWKRRS